MNKQQIKETLIAHGGKAHHVNRYVNFIFHFSNENAEGYTEKHHILPKADDMFPQYKDFSSFPWNRAVLTARQHIMAHIMLWRAFPKTRSQVSSVHYYMNCQNENLGTYKSRRLPTSIMIRYSAEAREEFYSKRSGFSSYRTKDGKYVGFLHKDDQIIKEMDLVGCAYNLKMSEESKTLMSRRKLTAKLYSSNEPITKRVVKYDQTNINEFSQEYKMLISKGWSEEKTEVFKNHQNLKRKDSYLRVSEKLSNRVSYEMQDGTFFGKLYKDDPRIQELDLKIKWTDKQYQSALKNVQKANQMRIGTKIYNDGKIQKRFKTDPGAPWVLGALPKHWEDKRIEACKGAIKGGSTWNDGVKNYRLAAGENPEPHWKRGLLRAKTNSKPSASIGKTTWNDGEKSFMVGPDEEIQPHWKRGLLRKPKQ